MLESLSRILTAAAASYGAKTALVIDDQRFSFAHLEALANQLAHALAGLGVSAGDRVTLYSPNSWEWVVSYYAVLKLGGVILP